MGAAITITLIVLSRNYGSYGHFFSDLVEKKVITLCTLSLTVRGNPIVRWSGGLAVDGEEETIACCSLGNERSPYRPTPKKQPFMQLWLAFVLLLFFLSFSSLVCSKMSLLQHRTEACCTAKPSVGGDTHKKHH
jgi:hypothetical protein